MGLFNFPSSARRRKRRAAERVGVETGLFQQCPVCREITEKQAPEALLQQTLEYGRTVGSGGRCKGRCLSWQ